MTLRVPRTLIVLGYLGVLAATAAWIYRRSRSQPGVDHLQHPHDRWLRSGGIGVVAVQQPQWLRDHRRLLIATTVTNYGGGFICFAVAFAVLTESYIRFHVANHIAYQQHYRLKVVGGSSCVVGFCLAAVGFWRASNTEVGLPTPDGEQSLVEAKR